MLSVVLVQLGRKPRKRSGWNGAGWVLLVFRNMYDTWIFEIVLPKTCLPCRVHCHSAVRKHLNHFQPRLWNGQENKSALLWEKKTTMLPFHSMLQCPCFRGYSTIALLLLRHMTINLLFSQADKCFLSITVNYICQLLIFSEYFNVYFVLNYFCMKFSCLIKIKKKYHKTKYSSRKKQKPWKSQS